MADLKKLPGDIRSRELCLRAVLTEIRISSGVINICVGYLRDEKTELVAHRSAEKYTKVFSDNERNSLTEKWLEEAYKLADYCIGDHQMLHFEKILFGGLMAHVLTEAMQVKTDERAAVQNWPLIVIPSSGQRVLATAWKLQNDCRVQVCYLCPSFREERICREGVRAVKPCVVFMSVATSNRLSFSWYRELYLKGCNVALGKMEFHSKGHFAQASDLLIFS